MKRNSLKARMTKSYESRDSGGTNFGSAFDWKKAGKDVKFYKVRDGKNQVNLIPYEVATNFHPLVRSSDMQIGDLDYVLDIWVHRATGPNRQDVVCPKKNWGKVCPVCDASSKAYNEGDQETGKSLKASRRVLYNVVDVLDPDAGVQILDASHYLFEKELIEAAREESSNDGIVDFADPDDGVSISFRAVEEEFGGSKFTKFKNFQFNKRTVAVEDQDLKDAVSFDLALKVLSPDEITKVLYGADEDDDFGAPAEEKPARSRKPADEDDDEPEEKPRARRAPQVEDDDEPPTRGRRVPDEDEPEEAPARSRKPADAEPPKKSNRECPSGHDFGKDCDEFPECESCDLWNACARAHK